VPSSAGASGNSIVPINPATGDVGAPVFVGSEPDKLALSDDGHTLYVALDGAFAVRRFDTQTRTPRAQFSVGLHNFFGVFRANDVAVAPSNPNLVAVARYYPGIFPSEAGVAVFNDGAQLPKTGAEHLAGSDYVAFPPNNASKLYGGGGDGGLRTMTLGESGVVSTAEANAGVGARIKFANGLVYGSAGKVMNPDTGLLLGTFTGGASLAFVPDPQAGRVYYLTGGDVFGSNSLTLHAYDINTYLELGTATINGVTGYPATLVRWGSNGLAFTTTTRQIYLIQTSLIPSADPIPSPTPSVSPTPTPQPTVFPAVIRKITGLPANDLALDPSGQTLYASVPTRGAGERGNSITPVDLQTGEIGVSTFVGSEPGKLSLADDGRTLYVNLEGAQAVRRFDIQTKTPGLQFPVGVNRLADLEAVPGSPQSVAVARGTIFTNNVAVFDDAVERPNISNGLDTANSIEFGSLPSLLYGYDTTSSGYPLVKHEVTPLGLKQIYSANSLLSGDEFKFAGGRLYGGNRVADPEAKTGVGTFVGGGGVIAVDVAAGRVYFLTGAQGISTAQITAYDINTFLPLGSITLPALTGRPITLLRWGTDGLAFCYRAMPNDATSSSGIYLVQSPLVASGAAGRSSFRLSAPAYAPLEGDSLVVTVTRTGGVANRATVNYATTGGGTATPLADYTPASGTLLFDAGETAKTFSVPLLDDAVYEGVETFGIELSSPSGDSLLADPSAATVAIQDNETLPAVNVVSLTVVEGDAGVTNADLTVRLSTTTTRTVTVQYKTSDGTATAGSDYVAASGTLTFAPGETQKTIPLQVLGDTVQEVNETFFIDFSNADNADASQRGIVTIRDDDVPIVQFGAASLAANEGDGHVTVTVGRTGGMAKPVTVTYSTVDDQRAVPCGDTTTAPGVAFARCDYATTVGTLTFAPGETQKTISVPIIDDSFVEPNERVQLRLSNPVGGILGTPLTTTVTITDNDTASTPNPYFDTNFFVRQQYLDFLSREPDPAGESVWRGLLADCPNQFNGDPNPDVNANPSARCDRITVSANFFLSSEFQLKGGYVLRFYKSSFGRLPHYTEFSFDTASTTGSTQADVFARKAAFANAWVQRQEFKSAYDALSNAQFVAALMDRYQLQSITTPNPATPDDTSDAAKVTLTRADLTSRLDAATMTRAQMVRAIADSNEVSGAEFNSAFVATQYFGYLRRDPDLAGYADWLSYLNSHPGQFRTMVFGFVNSPEYKSRFGAL
jgi:sugar lactone lactonase YvrE